MRDPTLDDLKKLEYALRQGDRIGNTERRIQTTVHRRALIIAPTYQDHRDAKTPGITWMPTTIRDAVLMHETLKARGYDPANIRILTNGFPAVDSASYPTRENIMESLKWLVASAEPGGYRFFHFAGHGVRRGSDNKKGKESREVNESRKPVFGDTERRLLPITSASGRLSSQRLKELVYYNEALVAQISGGTHGEETQGPPYLIYDSELNAQFAKLPPGSNLTCVLDCCASARILNNNVKLAGAGFRGAEPTGVGGFFQGISDGISGGLGAVKRRLLGDKMQEELPKEEQLMDKIQANALTWAACHQRQDSSNYRDPRLKYLTSGLFTRIWTDALQKDTDETPLKIKDLFESVSKETLEKAKGESNYWQYVQLWTSSADGAMSTQLQDKILEQRVTI